MRARHRGQALVRGTGGCAGGCSGSGIISAGRTRGDPSGLEVLLAAEDRAHLTAAVQQHLVVSWDQWIKHSVGKAADQDNDAVMAQLMQMDSATVEDFFDEIQDNAQIDFDDEEDDLGDDEIVTIMGNSKKWKKGLKFS